MSPTASEIHAIATRTRLWAERLAKRWGYCSDLSGMCDVASAKLFLMLKAKGYRPVLVTNKGHCHVRVKRRIVDITATQFGDEFKKVEIRPLAESNSHVSLNPSANVPYHGRIWKAETLHRSITSLRHHWSRDLPTARDLRLPIDKIPHR